MNDQTARRIHWSFWLLSLFALLWNVGGAVNYLMQTNPEYVANLPESHRAIIEGRPAWATGGFAIGVFGGALGCILLLLRKSTSLYVFIASLIGIIVTMIHTVKVASLKIEFSPGEILVMILLPLIVAAALVWYSRLAMSKHWIN
jgi:hypothetical protein